MNDEKGNSDLKIAPNIFTGFADIVSFFIAITSLPTIVTGLYEKSVLLIVLVLTVFLASLIWIFLRYRRAKYAAKNPKNFPSPTWLWRFITNEVPVGLGKVYGIDQRSKVLIICDNESESIAIAIVERYKDININFEIFDYRDISNIYVDLLNKLNSNDAVYLFWTKFIKNSNSAYQTINSWALKNSDKPVIVVNMIPNEYYYLTFNTVPKEAAISGIWLLFSRSIERAKIWRSQAGVYRKFSIGVITCLVVLIVFVGFRNIKLESNLKMFNTGAPESFRTKFWNNIAKLEDFYKKYFYNQICFNESDLNFYKNTIDKYTKHKLDFLENIIGMNVESPKLSFWKVIKNNSEVYLYEFAVSDNEHVKTGKSNDSIIGGAFENPHNFILWKKDMKDNEPACWDLNNDIKGNFVAEKSGKRYIRFIQKQYDCYFKNENKLPDQGRILTGVICFAFNTQNNIQIGVSLSITGGPIEFLTSEYTKQYLLSALSEISLLPNGFF